MKKNYDKPMMIVGLISAALILIGTIGGILCAAGIIHFWCN